MSTRLIRTTWFTAAIASTIGVLFVAVWLGRVERPSQRFVISGLDGIEARTGIEFPPDTTLIGARAVDGLFPPAVIAVVEMPTGRVADLLHAVHVDHILSRERALRDDAATRYGGTFPEWQPESQKRFRTVHAAAGRTTHSSGNPVLVQIGEAGDGTSTIYLEWQLL